MGKEKMIGQDGRQYIIKEKKAIYKKTWFWVLLILLVTVISSLLGNDKQPSPNGGEKVTPTTQTTQENKQQLSDYYKIGESVSVGEATYTLTNVEKSEERNQFDESNPEYVIKISYTVKNNSDNDLPVGTDVEAYDAQDKKMETYPNDNTLGSVAPGKQMDCVQHFGLNQLGEIEIHFAPLVSFEQAAIYKVKVE